MLGPKTQGWDFVSEKNHILQILGNLHCLFFLRHTLHHLDVYLSLWQQEWK
jgi:hypothetical protein